MSGSCPLLFANWAQSEEASFLPHQLLGCNLGRSGERRRPAVFQSACMVIYWDRPGSNKKQSDLQRSRHPLLPLQIGPNIS